MGYNEVFYPGADSGMNPIYGKPISHDVAFSSLGTTTNARTANQLEATSQSISSGAKAIEVQLTFAEIEKAIPRQHLEELNRLRKLTGVEFTVHGPMIEPTGINPEAGRWDESQRQRAEAQFISSIDKARLVNPDGNVVVTWHASHGLPEPRTRIMIEEDGERREVATGLAVIDKRTGAFGSLPRQIEQDYLTGEKADVDTALEKYNKQKWAQSLSNVNVSLHRTEGFLSDFQEKEGSDKAMNLFVLSKKDPIKYQGELDSMKKDAPELVNAMQNKVNNLTYTDIFVKEAYTGFRDLFNEAYSSASGEDKKKLDAYKNEVAPWIKLNEKDPSKLPEFEGYITKGIRMLDSLEHPPESFKPIKDFAIDEASKTFANVAFHAYGKNGKGSPIISIENPPLGSGLSRAEEIRELVEETRKKFEKRLIEEKHLSKTEAENQANKLVGATWDVGHINMLKKYGYTDEELKKQMEHIAPVIKHIHLSDNFGMDHAELPMGMGNVPMEAYEDILKKFGKETGNIKRVIEAGDWYQHFKTSPFAEVAASFGSPIYAAKMGPYWSKAMASSGGYQSGYGMNPDIHHSIYGAGFSSLPVELGGQMQGRSRMGGAPIE